MIYRADASSRRRTLAGSRARLVDFMNKTGNSQTEWYSIRLLNSDDRPTIPGGSDDNGDNPRRASIDIYGEIGFWGVEAAQFSTELRALDVDEIELHVNSPGGDIYDGIAIYNALVNHAATVDVRIDGLAASIASVIAQAGDSITIMPNAQMMIHDAWGMTIGNAEEHLKAVEELNRHSDNIASVYAVRSGRGTKGSWRKLMQSETWYSAQEAVDAGLADSVAKQTSRGNSADPISTWKQELAGFRYQGRAEAPAPELLPPPARSGTNIVWSADGVNVLTSAANSGGVVSSSSITLVGETGPETVLLPVGSSVHADKSEPEPEPAGLDPQLVFAALLRAEQSDQAAVSADVVTAGVSAAAQLISASSPIRDATATSYEPPTEEPYVPQSLPPTTSAEHILAATRAAASIAAEGDRVAVSGSSYEPPVEQPYVPEPSAPVTSAEHVLAATSSAASSVAAVGDPVASSVSSYEPPAAPTYDVSPATPISSAEWVLAATQAAVWDPSPAVNSNDAEHDLSSEANEHIRKGFLEVLLP